MKQVRVKTTIVTEIRIELTGQDIIKLLNVNNVITSEDVPTNAEVRVFHNYGDHFDIDNDFPVVITFSKRETKDDD